MGAKTGYADAILRVLGLAPGARAAHYLWCEPDPGVRLLLEAYRDADLARAAAAIIRSWADEEPRALWERLRAEGPPVLPATGAEVARHALTAGWAFRPGHPESGFRDPYGGFSGSGSTDTVTLAGMVRRLDTAPTLPATIAPAARTVDPREVARWAWLGNRTMPQALARGATDGYFYGGKVATAAGLAAQMERNTLPATIHPDARDVYPPALPPGTIAYMDPPYSDVAPMIPPVPAAQFLPLGTCGREEGDAALRASDLDHLREPVTHLRMAVLEVLRAAGVQAKVLDTVVERIVIDVVDDLVWSQFASDVALHDKAMLANAPAVVHEHPVPVLDPALALAGATEGCLGLDIGGDLRQFALRCQAQPGAVVCISEAEPIPELTADGWHAVRIDGERQGQKRTFSKQQAEWLTLSHPPAWRPSVQAGLFA